VANLLEILAACEGGTPDAHAQRFVNYRELKEAAAEAVTAALRPVQRRYVELMAAPEGLGRVRREGAARARERTGATVRRAKRAIGLLDPSP